MRAGLFRVWEVFWLDRGLIGFCGFRGFAFSFYFYSNTTLIPTFLIKN
ncbi:hypothetical protein HPHPH44_1347 [Helicobacter pylori Hp H-44]|nr:hypothetical protein HPHPH44_1347 [Helicobacter pylori Hp H-44]